MDEDKTKAPFGKVTLHSTSVSVYFSTRNLKDFFPLKASMILWYL